MDFKIIIQNKAFISWPRAVIIILGFKYDSAAVDGSFTKVLSINRVQYHVPKKCPRGPWSYTMCLSLAESRTAEFKTVCQPEKEEERETDTVTVCQAWGSALCEHHSIWDHKLERERDVFVASVKPLTIGSISTFKISSLASTYP